MLRPLSHFTVIGLLLAAQAAGLSSAPLSAGCPAERCCGAESGTSDPSCCCSRRVDDGPDCCHAESSTSCCGTLCSCGCSRNSAPAAPDSGSDRQREREQVLRAFCVAGFPAAALISGVSREPLSLTAHSGPAFYAGLSWQPLACSWLL